MIGEASFAEHGWPATRVDSQADLIAQDLQDEITAAISPDPRQPFSWPPEDDGRPGEVVRAVLFVVAVLRDNADVMVDGCRLAALRLAGDLEREYRLRVDA